MARVCLPQQKHGHLLPFKMEFDEVSFIRLILCLPYFIVYEFCMARNKRTVIKSWDTVVKYMQCQPKKANERQPGPEVECSGRRK